MIFYFVLHVLVHLLSCGRLDSIAAARVQRVHRALSHALRSAQPHAPRAALIRSAEALRASRERCGSHSMFSFPSFSEAI